MAYPGDDFLGYVLVDVRIMLPEKTGNARRARVERLEPLHSCSKGLPVHDAGAARLLGEILTPKKREGILVSPKR